MKPSASDASSAQRFSSVVRDSVRRGMSLDSAIAAGVKTVTKRSFGKDALTRFRAAVRDAARENMPLPKIIEMGVISGTNHVESTPESNGSLAKEIPMTHDQKRIRKFLDTAAPMLKAPNATPLVAKVPTADKRKK